MSEASNNVTVQCKAEERLLSSVEVMYIKLGNLNPPTSLYFHVNVLHSEKKIAEDLVRKSLFEVSKLHMLLQAKCVLTDTEDYLFQRVPQFSQDSKWINIQSIDVTSKDEWLSTVTEDLKTPFEISEGPLWRVLWLTVRSEDAGFNYILVFVSSHAIIDFRSCMDLIHTQFLPLLNDLIKGNEFQSIHEDSIMLAYPAERVYLNGIKESNYSHIKFEIPWYVKAPLDFGLWLQKKGFFLPEVKPKCREFDDLNPKLSLNHFPFSIEKTQARKFGQVCKKNNVSVHSVLVVLLGNAFSNATKEFPSCTFDGNISFIIDLRKFNKELSTSPYPLGSYTSRSNIKYQETNTSDKVKFFEFCRKVNSEVKKNNRPETSVTLASVFNYLMKSMDFNKFMDFFKVVTLSNGGNFNFDFESTSGVTLQEQYFSVSLPDKTAFITTLTYNGTMFFCIGLDCKWFSKRFAQFIADDLRKSINYLVNE